MPNYIPNNSSFRDPSGFISQRNNKIIRIVNSSYKEHYDYLKSSGLKNKLVNKKKMINFIEIENKDKDIYKIIQPEMINTITYPYEWSFSQLKDAALLTLDIQEESIKKDMLLKDSSAFNIQFQANKPVFIDHLSFTKVFNKNYTWPGYNQFCKHFLAPLALMAYSTINLNKLFWSNIDGINIEDAAKILPFKTYFYLNTLVHIHLHSVSIKKYSISDETKTKTKRIISKNEQLMFIENLKNSIKKIKLGKIHTEWSEYYENTNYSNISEKNKISTIKKFVANFKIESIIDIGGNSGKYTKIFNGKKLKEIIVLDKDPLAIEKLYTQSKLDKSNITHPIIFDIANPSPAIGILNEERVTLEKRVQQKDLILALALIHHLIIGNNLNFEQVSNFLLRFTKKLLIIEFVSKDDSQVKKMLSTREDVFEHYDEFEFENKFKKNFTILKKEVIKQSNRILYLMKRR